MKIVTANGKQRIKMSKSEWKAIGIKAQWMSPYETVDIGPVPNGEDCAQVGSEKYDSYALNKMEVRAYIGQLQRMFPDTPAGCRFVMTKNEHEFGTYYEVGVKFRSSDDFEAYDEDGNKKYDTDPNMEYAYKVENNAPEKWDDQAIAELQQQGYFKIIPRKMT
jgi:hypothetical protein